MPRHRVSFLAMLLIPPACAHGGVVVEQLEANESATAYAPIDFGGQSTVPGTGHFAGVTFHALNVLNTTFSYHARDVGETIYGNLAPTWPNTPFVTDVYAGSADAFLMYVAKDQAPVSTTAILPGNFAAGVQIVNNSYVGSDTSKNTQRRLDYMIDHNDVFFAAAAANSAFDGLAGDNLTWSSYNSLAITGSQGFDPTGSPGKPHADVGMGSTAASIYTGQISGYAAGLYGLGQAAGQTDALHGPVMRSLFMTGADKIGYARQTTNNLSFTVGAGQANYATSVSLLQGGEQLPQPVIGSAIPGSLSTSRQGWTYGAVPASGKSVVMFHTASPITGVTASLNWNVTSNTTATTIDTTDAGVSFPSLGLELFPVSFSNGQYVLGPSFSDNTLKSYTANDNVQYLYSTGTLPAGNYAFVITGDAAKSPNVGFSYNVNSATTPDQWQLTTGSSWWNSAAWSSGIPNANAAQANFLATPSGLTAPGSIALNSNATVGEITFNNAQSYSIDPGAGGILTINDSNDAGGAYPSIMVIAGSHSITAPVSLTNGVTVNTVVGTSLKINGNLTGVGGLVAAGRGTLTLGGIDNYGDTTVSGGALTINGVISSANVSVATGATLIANGTLSPATALSANGVANLGPNTGTTVVARTLGTIAVGSGGLVTLGAEANGNRTVLVTSGLTISNFGPTWTGKLDLNNNDMIVKGGSLANLVSQLKQGFNAGQGFWNGAGGIISTSAANNTSFLTTLAIIQNNDGFSNRIYGTGAPYGPFDGQNVNLNDILIKYTYFGDADLSGSIDGRDYAKIDAGFGQHLTGWVNGDFNNDGVVNGSDFTLIDNAFNQQGPNLSATSLSLIANNTATLATPTSISSVPEPASFITLLTVAGLSLRRHRTNKQRGS